jgi:amidase
MRLSEYGSYDAVGLAELVRRKEVTPSELVDTAIVQIERLNPDLNAVIDLLYERARKRVKNGLADGPLRGVPFLIKDLVAYEGAKLTFGSVLLRGNVSHYTHEVVRRLEAAGLVVVGRTNTSELGLLPTSEPALYGATHNPWNAEHSAGGSSGGSAAAVAARMVPAAHGNDGGGSIRIPAACCGVFGLKPSRGRNPGHHLDEPDGFAVEHCLTRSVRDSAALLDVTQGAQPGSRWWAPPPEGPYAAAAARDPKPLKIALATTDLAGRPAAPDCRDAAEEAAQLCEELGHSVEVASPAIDGTAFNEAFSVLWGTVTGLVFKIVSRDIDKLEIPGLAKRLLVYRPVFDVATRIRFPGAGAPGLELFTRRLARLESEQSPADNWLAWQVMQKAAYSLAAFFERYDLLLTPTLGQAPWKIGALDHGAPIETLREQLLSYVGYTPICNTSGVPAMSVPLVWNERGLPIGVQFVAPFAREDRLFALAGQLERARPWSERRAPLGG